MDGWTSGSGEGRLGCIKWQEILTFTPVTKTSLVNKKPLKKKYIYIHQRSEDAKRPVRTKFQK